MSSSSSENSDEEGGHKNQIREELSSMSFEEIMKLKEELGAKVYREAVLGVDKDDDRKHKGKKNNDFKRLNKNRPREQSTKRQVPFLGVEMRTSRKSEAKQEHDPRFDESAGTYDVNSFKKNYKFLSKIRNKEVEQLKSQLRETHDDKDRASIKDAMLRLRNKNVEDRNWHARQRVVNKEQQEIQKAYDEGKIPHYVTKKERRAKELVTQFEELKRTGKLSRHMEKRRKKNAAKDRKRIGFD